jgi:hypothetical protein
MRHLMTLALCTLPALALGQSDMTVRGGQDRSWLNIVGPL